MASDRLASVVIAVNLLMIAASMATILVMLVGHYVFGVG